MSSAAALDVSDSQYDSQGTLTLGQTPPQARPKPSTSGALAESGGSNSSSWEILESQESDPQSEVINVGSEVLPDAAAVAASEAGESPLPSGSLLEVLHSSLQVQRQILQEIKKLQAANVSRSRSPVRDRR